jgi:TPR repeat protein
MRKIVALCALCLLPLAAVGLSGCGKKDAPKGDKLSPSEKKCEDDDLAACVKAGKEAYEDDQDYDKTKKYEKKACDGGEAQGCELLAGLYLLGKGVKKDEEKAVELFQKACDGDDAHGCEALGKMFRDGRGVTADLGKAKKFLTKACDADAYGACTSLALDAMKSGDKDKGVELMTKACNGDDKIGCMGLGALYLHGNGVKKDLEKAKQILGKSCKLGEKSACKKLEEL